jgi:hypothetical protein
MCKFARVEQSSLLDVDLAGSREVAEPVLKLLRVGSLV